MQEQIVPESELFQKIEAELKNFDEGTFSPDAMRLVLAYKQKRRKEKNKPENNSFVLHIRQPKDFCDFLRFLRDEQSHFTDNTRFQIAYLTEVHWSVMDVRLKNNTWEFYLFDAPHRVKDALFYIFHIYKILSRPTVRYSGYMRDGKGIQTDGYNCATFVADHVFQLSRIVDLHDILADILPINNIFTQWLTKNIAELPGDMIFDPAFDDIAHIKCIPFRKFTPELAPLLRNAQNFTTLAKEKMEPATSQSLMKYVTGKDVLEPFFNETTGEEEKKNNAIKRKRQNIKRKALAFLHENNFKENPDKLNALLRDHSDYTLILKKRTEDLPENLASARSSLDSVSLAESQFVPAENKESSQVAQVTQPIQEAQQPQKTLRPFASDAPFLSEASNRKERLEPFFKEFRNNSTARFFEIFDSGQYNRALRMACNSDLPQATAMVGALVNNRHICPLNPYEEAGPKNKNAFDYAKNKPAMCKLLDEAWPRSSSEKSSGFLRSLINIKMG